jgi:hypothetical protein
VQAVDLDQTVRVELSPKTIEMMKEADLWRPPMGLEEDPLFREATKRPEIRGANAETGDN